MHLRMAAAFDSVEEKRMLRAKSVQGNLHELNLPRVQGSGFRVQGLGFRV